MNGWRLAGDASHLLSKLLLLRKLVGTQSCAGVSFQTQLLYLLVFLSRYLDLLYSFISVYNSLMKVVYIASSLVVLYYMRLHRVVRETYDRKQDTFRPLALVLPCLLLAPLLMQRHGRPFAVTVYTLTEGLWTFSLLLESLAILPQLVLLRRVEGVDNLTLNYVFLLGIYRALYILNWVQRYSIEPRFWQPVAWVSGLVQTVLYTDFFVYFFHVLIMAPALPSFSSLQPWQLPAMEAGPVLKCLQPLLGLVAPLPPDDGSAAEELARQAQPAQQAQQQQQQQQQQAGRGVAAQGAGGEEGLEEARLPLILHAHDAAAGVERGAAAGAADVEAASVGDANSGPRLG